jgi:hypothetical protein
MSGAKEKMELNRLRLENAQLLARFEIGEAPLSLETWALMGSQETRDGFAARALVAEWGNQAKALARLGFPIFHSEKQPWTYKPKLVKELAEAIFTTPGVKAILDNDFKAVDESWQAILERTRKIALHGTDENAVKAAALLAKVEGRVQDQAPPQATSINLAVLVNGASPHNVEQKNVTTHDPVALLAHEPSDTGVRIDTGDKTIDEVLSRQ